MPADGRKDGRTERRTDRRKDIRTDGGSNEETGNGYKDGRCLHGRKDGRTDGRTTRFYRELYYAILFYTAEDATVVSRE